MKIAGCTGTALTESQEFFEIYDLKVVSIPTNKKRLDRILMIKFLERKKKNKML